MNSILSVGYEPQNKHPEKKQVSNRGSSEGAKIDESGLTFRDHLVSRIEPSSSNYTVSHPLEGGTRVFVPRDERTPFAHSKQVTVLYESSVATRPEGVPKYDPVNVIG
ncbi:hypothetical protein ISS07_00130 [Candidatus Woesearchaeota archaeon]|nr:hypothetical protein [Candidatus Woesearchaeota archaeon]